tara:strand:+ start:705 stop:1109 length:405 start_codon:yes stop_codon:yes gene_type:complete
MNLNRNPRFENFDIDDNREIVAIFRQHFDQMWETMPEGPKVSTSDVDLVFDQIRRGENPFDGGSPLPVDMPDGDLTLWVRDMFRAGRKNRRGIRSLGTLAKRMDLTVRELRERIKSPNDRVRADLWAALSRNLG